MNNSKKALVIATNGGNFVVFVPQQGTEPMVICISPKGDFLPWGSERDQAKKMSHLNWATMKKLNGINMRPATEQEIAWANTANEKRESFLSLSTADRIAYMTRTSSKKKFFKKIKPSSIKTETSIIETAPEKVVGGKMDRFQVKKTAAPKKTKVTKGKSEVGGELSDNPVLLALKEKLTATKAVGSKKIRAKKVAA